MQNKAILESRFCASIAQVEELLAIYRFIAKSPTVPVADNLLRATLTMLVSTIDTTVHELVVNAVIQHLASGNYSPTLSNFCVNIACIIESDPNLRLQFTENDLRKQLSKETFQSSRQIETALSKIGISKIWSRLSSKLNMSPDKIKLNLDLMVRRRNQIVHQGDLDSLHVPQAIDFQTIETLTAFTTDFVTGIISEFSDL